MKNTATQHPILAAPETEAEQVNEPLRPANANRVWIVPAGVIALTIVILAITSFTGAPLSLSGLLESWAAITAAVVLQATPFLALGVIVSGAIAAFVPPSALARITPNNEFAAVPAAASCGFLLPGCECGAVPVAHRLISGGLPPAAALAFLLASPAINPVVLISTAIAFNGNPAMVWARLIASLLATVLVGWLWITFHGSFPFADAGRATHGHGHIANRWEVFRASAVHDLLNAGGYLVIGAMAAALIKVAVPARWFYIISDMPIVAYLFMAALAVTLSLCSEADAFIATSFTAVSPTAQLVFLVVGPMVDFKLIAMQYGMWGKNFVARFVPLALVFSIVSAILVGGLIFGTF